MRLSQYQALDRAFKKDGLVPARIIKPFTAHVRGLFSGVLNFTEFKRVTRVLLEEGCAPRDTDSAGGDFSVYSYLAKNWLSIRYRPLVSKAFRALLPRLGIDTTNIVEGEWSVLKVWHLPLLAYKDVRSLIKRLSGLPLPGETQSRNLSLVAQRIAVMDDIASGVSRRGRFYKIDIMLRLVKMLLARARACASADSSLIRYDPAFSTETARKLGAYVVGTTYRAGHP